MSDYYPETFDELLSSLDIEETESDTLMGFPIVYTNDLLEADREVK